MRYFIYLSCILCVAFFSSCSGEYKKLKGGYEYKIISSGQEGPALAYGTFFSYHTSRRYVNTGKDTLLGDSREYFMPRIHALDSSNMQSSWLKILTGAKKGDSIVIRIPTDSAYRKFVSRMPAYLEKGGYVYTTFKILDIFENREEADVVNLAEFKKYSQSIYQKSLKTFEDSIRKNEDKIKSDAAIISAFLDKKNIPFKRGKWGTFIVVQEEGTGRQITSSDVVGINYTGKIFRTGKVFDSNIDSQFHHVETLEITMSQLGGVMPGLTDALLELKKGSRATIYVPYALVLTGKSKKSKIQPGDIVELDLEVTGLLTEYEAMEIVNANRRREDSMKKIPAPMKLQGK